MVSLHIFFFKKEYIYIHGFYLRQITKLNHSVRETTESGAQVVIIDLHNGNSIVRRNISADSAIMNPTQNVLALRAQGRTLQIFNLDLKQKLKSHTMDEDVVYWKWFNDKSLVLVTDTSIYHWDIIDSTQPAPVKITERHVSLAVST